jgi:hypothetical protein
MMAETQHKSSNTLLWGQYVAQRCSRKSSRFVENGRTHVKTEINNPFLPLGDDKLEFTTWPPNTLGKILQVFTLYGKKKKASFYTMSVARAIGPSVITSSTDFSFQNLVFLEFIWIFSVRNHLKIDISHILNLNHTK